MEGKYGIHWLQSFGQWRTDRVRMDDTNTLISTGMQHNGNAPDRVIDGQLELSLAADRSDTHRLRPPFLSSSSINSIALYSKSSHPSTDAREGEGSMTVARISSPHIMETGPAGSRSFILRPFKSPAPRHARKERKKEKKSVGSVSQGTKSAMTPPALCWHSLRSGEHRAPLFSHV